MLPITRQIKLFQIRDPSKLKLRRQCYISDQQSEPLVKTLPKASNSKIATNVATCILLTPLRIATVDLCWCTHRK